VLAHAGENRTMRRRTQVDTLVAEIGFSHGGNNCIGTLRDQYSSRYCGLP